MLIGDAAHPMLQYLGQGACQALEDAVELGHRFQCNTTTGTVDVDQAYREFGHARIPRTARRQTSARPWGELWHTDTPLVLALRNRLFAQRADDDYHELDWLYAPWRPGPRPRRSPGSGPAPRKRPRPRGDAHVLSDPTEATERPMRYLSFLDSSGRQWVGATDHARASTIRDVTDLLPAGDNSPMLRLIAAAPDGDLGALLAEAVPVDATTATLLPVVPDPSKIVAAPVNYRAHQAEMNVSSRVDSLGVFLKAPSSVITDNDVVRLPYTDRRFDQEGEFAVIGRRTRNVTEEDALDAVFGYTCLLDMTMRGGEDESVRKSFDTFTPIGPTVVTAGHVPPIDDLQIRLRVNGVLRRPSTCAVWCGGCRGLIAYVSSVMTLLPGDIVTTGTPEGVGEVHDGDRIELEITGLDRLSVGVCSAGAVACPTRGAQHGPVPPRGLTPVAERATQESR